VIKKKMQHKKIKAKTLIKPRRIRWWLDEKLAWTLFRTVSNSYAVKLTIFIPLIGYWIIFNDKLLEIITLSKKIIDPNVVPDSNISINLLCLYFGLCFIAIASFLYQVLCPRIIKKYGTPIEYIAGDRDHIGRAEFDEVQRVLEDSSNPLIVSRYKSVDIRYLQNEERILPAEWPEAKSDILTIHFDMLNMQHPIWRKIVAGIYIVGFSVLSIPSLSVFGKVSFLLLFSFIAFLKSIVNIFS
jgi:hypothetical protein